MTENRRGTVRTFDMDKGQRLTIVLKTREHENQDAEYVIEVSGIHTMTLTRNTTELLRDELTKILDATPGFPIAV